MEQVGVRDLTQNASQVLRRVMAGESLEVTERGRPIARLTPVADDADGDLLSDRGELSPGDQDLLGGRPVRIASEALLSVELESLRDDWR
jgi:prevent-host-death family protein